MAIGSDGDQLFAFYPQNSSPGGRLFGALASAEHVA